MRHIEKECHMWEAGRGEAGSGELAGGGRHRRVANCNITKQRLRAEGYFTRSHQKQRLSIVSDQPKVKGHPSLVLVELL